MRALEENKMASIEAGGAGRLVSCGICIIAAIAAGIFWEELCAWMATDPYKAAGAVGYAVESCAVCIFGTGDDE